ncbi:MAG TPA: DUF3616 domain-containing protein [Pyrinomonadaceae bacterium]|nr:DUF3616 domain-containing protein [Pyrinomonadaceae bacterium]
MFSRLRYWHLVLAVGLFVAAMLYFSRASTQAPAGGAARGGMTAFEGGTFEASGVAAVAGADGVLFVDNGKPGQVFWMRLGPEGRQLGPVKPLSLGADIEDIEGITTDGTHFYVVSSQSRPKAIAKAGLVRFRFDAAGEKVEAAESVGGLKNFLLENVAELRGEGELKGKEGGLNIEGVAWDPRGGRLLLGLRSPLAEGNALLVPVKLRDPRGAFAAANLEVEGSRAIRLPLGGFGIRGVEYDASAGLFRLLSGATETQTLTDFGLWEWNGDEKQPAPRQTAKFDRQLKPEGVARARAGGREMTIVVFDAGGYTVMN